MRSAPSIVPVSLSLAIDDSVSRLARASPASRARDALSRVSRARTALGVSTIAVAIEGASMRTGAI
jgi:hypothetical protein|tara:strand:+ start:5441 stop:5638 length:198 start_codon:yes stop_codon:yes gene_type:complete